ncbi:sulfatase [Lacihabitans sp. CCS-44]|uniref:sulfatase-like hydrolase/transferase n=1 Tax=Lacihabitans sp. CCS-44 TaxID=2487331 RepID=UPI0020CF766A|nr:sulfatase-like hydrolase/transferase [Lacihabitans sp. CCS-44]MCP9755511.1 sulfatase [Lacihabitans sp. CCS-44]
MKPNLQISKYGKYAVLIPILLCLGFVVDTNLKQNQQQNILWITCEDMSPEHLGCYGGKVAKTPNIDQLASDGVQYSKVYSTAGVCAPSRNALISGMYQTSIGGHNMRNYLPGNVKIPGLENLPNYSIVTPESFRCFPEYLRKAGYYCTNNEKQDYQFEAPVTVWDENSRKADWRGRSSKSQPFFSIINFMDTHESQIFSRDNRPLTVDPKNVILSPFVPDTEAQRKDLARHLSNIEEMDKKLGEVIAKLKEDGLYENTIIFFYSDHGDGLPYAKRELYERGLKVPLIIKFPKNANAGKKDNQLISFVDFAPTVLSLAGLDIPKFMQGQSFLGEKASKIQRKYIYAARDRMDSEVDRVRAVSDGRFKYLKNYMPDKPYYQDIQYRMSIKGMSELIQLRDQGKLSGLQMHWFRSNKPQEELFDTSVDPFETNNLAERPEFKTKLLELRAMHEQWLRKYGDLGSISESEVVKKWQAGKDYNLKTGNPKISPSSNFVKIECSTKGASIGYKRHKSDLSWKVYDKPIKVSKGDTIICFAHRIGSLSSDVITRVF